MSFIRNSQSINSMNTSTTMGTDGPTAYKFPWATESSGITTVKAQNSIVNGAFSSGTSGVYEMHWSTATERAQYGCYFYTTGQVLSASVDECIGNGVSFSLVMPSSADTTVSRAQIWRLA